MPSLLLSSIVFELSGLPTTIDIAKPRISKCYLWTDPYRIEEKTIELGSYPPPKSFFARKARSTSCDKLHHFEIFYLKKAKISQGKSADFALRKSFCEQKAIINQKSRNLASYIYAASVGNKKTGRFFACLVTGSITPGVAAKTYFFEELFESLIDLENMR